MKMYQRNRKEKDIMTE
jgi:hypothetical protein